MQNQSDNKRLAKNTLLLYFRMFIMMGISLFTSRVILQTLGVSDYGIYNVVAGAIMMVGFVMASFATASSRFITIAIGKGETEEMKNTFMHNAEDVIQRGLNAMTVPDWKVTVVDMEEEEDE